MSADLIDRYAKSGLISDPTRNFRPCDGCGRRCHPDDFMTRDVENYGRHETIELCERCDTPPEPVQMACLFTHRRRQDPKSRLFMEFMVDRIAASVTGGAR